MKRRELAIAFALFLTVAGSGSFIAAYATSESTLYEGIGLGCAALGLCLAALGWAFWILPERQVVDEIVTYPSPPSEQLAQESAIELGIEEISRPRLLLAVLGAALASFGAALIVPIRSLGPKIGDTLFHTAWRKGSVLVRDDGRPVRVTDLEVDSAILVFPQNAIEDAMSQTMLVRVTDSEAPDTNGYVAYSRVCTHAGCPVALYRAAARQLMCPCHQSVFNVIGDGAVVSGPADHALPRLPIAVGDDGVLHALGDFPEPVGPGFWEENRQA
ncbi:MAG TPA: Rieske (2Fe-2S) protein [Candidatus Baltobacteraceae bacterium]|nr:Rieske (2Fe-2S) protein [Candidatus Baltobacteraceae bacterium]